MKTKWLELVERFHNLAKITGTDKMGSYEIRIVFTYHEAAIYIDMNTYDIGDWPRHTNLGPFENEEDALIAFEKKIIEAEQELAHYRIDLENK